MQGLALRVSGCHAVFILSVWGLQMLMRTGLPQQLVLLAVIALALCAMAIGSG